MRETATQNHLNVARHRYSNLHSRVAMSYRNIAAFTISALSILAVWAHQQYQYTDSYTTITYLFTAYIAADSFHSLAPDFRIHHLFSLMFGYYQWVHAPDYSIPIVATTMYHALNNEISSLFLVLKHWITHPWLAAINNLAFMVTFFKYRLLDYYAHLIHPSSTMYAMAALYETDSAIAKYGLIVPIWGLFALNLYWFTIILKMVYKQFIRNHSNSLAVQHAVCSYIGFIQLPVSIYRYIQYTAFPRFAFHVLFGVVFLSISSYHYHQYIYREIVDNANNTYQWPPVNSNQWYTWKILFTKDQWAIHVRCLLCIFSAYEGDPFVFCVSACIHAASIYAMKRHLSNPCGGSMDPFFAVNRMIVSVPIVCDVILLMCKISSEDAIGLAISSYMMILVASIRPFYQWTHIGLHAWAIVQAYYIVSPRQ